MARRIGAGLAGAALLIALITLLSRVVGFGRWLVYSNQVSAMCVGNVYSAVNQLPNVLFEVVAGGALVAAVVPLLAGPLARAGGPGADPAHAREADTIASALLSWAVLVLTPLSLAVALAAGPLARVLVNETTCAGGQTLGARMLLVFAPQVVLYGLGVVLTGILQARHRFFWPAFGPLLSSLVVVGGYVGFGAAVGTHRDDAAGLPWTAEAWLAWGTTAGVAVMTLPLLIPVRRAGTRLRWTLRFPPGVARRALHLAGAGLAALVAQQASVVTVLLLARASGQASTLNIYQYTQAVYLLPYAVLVVPLATAAFPRLAAAHATGDRAGFAATAAATTRVVILVCALGAAVLVAVSGPVGAFFAVLDHGDVTSMSATLAAMAPGLVGFGLIAHVGRALYALEAGAAAAVATVSGWAAVVAAMIGLHYIWPGSSTALALGAGTALGMCLAAVLLLAALHRRAGAPALAGVPRSLLAALAGGAAGAWVGSLTAGRLLDTLGTGLVGSLTSGAAAGGVCLVVLLLIAAVADPSGTRQAGRRLRRRTPPPDPAGDAAPPDGVG